MHDHSGKNEGRGSMIKKRTLGAFGRVAKNIKKHCLANYTSTRVSTPKARVVEIRGYIINSYTVSSELSSGNFSSRLDLLICLESN